MNRAGIVGMGLWVPETIRGNDAWPDSFRESFAEKQRTRTSVDLMHVEPTRPGRPYEELFRRHAKPHEGDPFKGTVERRVAPRDMPSVEGDAKAALSAIADAGIAPTDVSHILSSAVVPDRVCPPNAAAIQHLSGCVNACALGVEAYCGSAPAQLELAAALVEAGRARFVVCVQSQHIARVMDLSHPSSPVFGDASSAFVVGSVPTGRGLLGVVSKTDGALAGGVTWNYESCPTGGWRSGTQGPLFLGAEDHDALRRLVDNALLYPIDSIRKVCSTAGVPLDALAAVATIQPLVWYQAAIADGLGISPARAPSTHARYAHIGSCAIIANLMDARERGSLQDGAPVVLYGHGAGVTLCAALLRWTGRG
jgi:3-oxoacyl-[acyl-carrier-protein] synthase III